MALRAAPDPERERRAVVAAHLQRLVGMQEWDVFRARALEMEQDLLSRLRTAKREDVEALQGRLLGIADTLHLPERLIAASRRP